MENYFLAGRLKKIPPRMEIFTLSIEQESWNKSRILWRAKQYKWDSLTGCSYFDQSTDSGKHILGLQILQGEPILVEWKNQANWLVLTTNEVVSLVENSINRTSLAEIAHLVVISSSKNTELLKEEVDTLSVGVDRKKIWTGPGPVLFALASILKMFPLAQSI